MYSIIFHFRKVLETVEDILTEFDLYKESDESDPSEQESVDGSTDDPDYEDPVEKGEKEENSETASEVGDSEVELDPVSAAGCSGDRSDGGLVGLVGASIGERTAGGDREGGGHKRK